MNEFTGERVVPGEVEVDLWNEHVARYALARKYAEGQRVLDIGCGTGYGAADLSRSATSVVGLDCSEEAIRYARAHYPVANLSFVPGSGSELPFASESFDLVTTFEVIEHLVNWRDLLSEVRRVIRPNGLVIISTPNREYYAESRRLEGPNPFHHHEFEADEFVSELSAFFPNVSLLLQNRTEAMTFYPDKTFAPAAAQIESGGGSAADAHFFVALCSVGAGCAKQSFIYVPRAANVLREREQHIALLEGELRLKEQWLEQVRAERDQLHAALEDLKEHLEQQNRWALQLDEELGVARARIVELQDEAAQLRSGYEAHVQQLEAENNRKTEWATGLNADIQKLRAQVEVTEATLQERTRWALELDGRVQSLEAQVAMARSSRWLRLGRQFNVGPSL